MGIKAFSRAGVMRRLFNSPLAVMPETAAIVLGAVGERYDIDRMFVQLDGQSLDLSMDDMEDLAHDERLKIEARGGVDRTAHSRPADRLMFVHNGVAHVGIRGETVEENGIGPMSGFTGYDGIAASVASADADPNVRGVLLDINSPGGEVSGLFELASLLEARRGKKPMRAMIRGCGCSAAYAIAASADEITLHPTGSAGSIGIIAMHADFSEALKQDGVKVTMIAAGANKTDGNPFEPLPERVAAEFQQRVDKSYSRFVSHVASARSLDSEAVRAQEARTYQGQAALDAGLVDKVMSWSESMDDFEQQVNGGGVSSPPISSAQGARSTQENEMSDAKAPAAEAPEDNQAAIDAARAEGHAAGVTEGSAAATTAEQERITALAELDAGSTISPELATAITENQSAGDFAIAQNKAATAKKEAALDGAKKGAVDADKIPEKGAAKGEQEAVNRGEAAVSRMAGKHPGLPKKAAG